MHVPSPVDTPFPNVQVQWKKRYFETGDPRVPNFPSFGSESLAQLRRKKKETRPWVVLMQPESLQVGGLQGAKTAWAGVKLKGKADDTWKPQWVSLRDTRKEAPFYYRPMMQRSSQAKGCFLISTGRCGMHEGKQDPIGGSSSMANSGGHI
ncbi:carbon-nitrogen hydrolase [Penicillium hispanicum]|uniref:carbon-nitrogen hydrolase n=1 Tax=Penicillium hispanicum TaxID=1080232 RepID=UPI002540919D|nr:carbon-nitrogen hydrolase [Penicillium hispanicum]KAJ5580200.1 carbon-nitrogen hydrolase [Penicillium hispanicum]